LAAITGVGLITLLGANPISNWNALSAGHAIEDHARLADEHLPEVRSLPRISRIGLAAARQAMAASNATIDPTTALILGTSKGAIEQWLRVDHCATLLNPSTCFGLATTASDVAAGLGWIGPRLTLSAACASGLCALIRGVMLIESGAAQRVLVVAAEASVHPLFLASFKRLGVLPPPGRGCRPFDQTRQGFLMSEAAAAVCLEARQSPAPGDVYVDRIAMGADGTHLTASDPEAAGLENVLRQVLEDPVDLIHAHGTGTPMNDQVELKVLERLIPSDAPTPLLYSHKGALGHSLGAAGLVSVVINVMCHRQGIVPPNIRTMDPLPTQRMKISNRAERRSIHRSIAVAAGFGGPIAAVRLSSSG
jgi:3-oxoacyl-[acyl-carrier-protein] synthase II